MKTKQAFFNTITGIGYYFFTIIANIISRKALISVLGIQYQGVDGLFSSILSMLSIAELGISSAILYNLYKPVKENDFELIKQLMLFYKKAYRLIAFIVAFFGFLLMPFLGYFVPDYTLPLPLVSVYLWYLLDVIFSYFFSYKRSLLLADQKNYIINICDSLYQITSRALQAILLYLTGNFYYFLIAMVICRIFDNTILVIIVNRRYPYILQDAEERLPSFILNDIKFKIKGAVFHKIGSFVVNGTDNLLISLFCGLRDVGIYSNYQLILSALSRIAMQLTNGSISGVGHLLVENNIKKTREVFDELQLLNSYISILASVGFWCISSKVVSCIFGVEYILDPFVLIILSVNLYLTGMRRTFAAFKEAAGILYEDRFIPIMESIVNIIVSILFANYFGLAGIFLGTIISSSFLFFYSFPIYIYIKILERSYKKYCLELAHISSIYIIIMFACSYTIKAIKITNNFLYIIISCIIVILESSFLFYFIYAFNRPETLSLLKRFKAIVLK